ncbi:CapA family protein [Halalkalicoccus sp. NIPERK01]|uniref:CapA family protein n=1 Tax=Halalkalicoccus sp. NIPERK01 TaxID=3053469 RepID=UPI00256F6584|nr:CapA family protein [Halalkalicoccus sp. NIPERK01]MDL5363402.1 CapA family protein [Halalkalicoccus sp. NIPERK01]
MYGTEGERLSMIVAGDAIVTRRISSCEVDAFRQVVDLVRSADVSLANLEVLLCDYDDGYPAAQSGGTYMRAPPWVVDELTWFGFDAFAAATNHTGDFGIGGIEATMAHLENRAVPYAGLGNNLATAREPAYVETAAGRVGLVAACSTVVPGTVAGQQRSDMGGRPGLSPLRFDTAYEVPSETIEMLRETSETLGLEGIKRDAKHQGFPVPGEDEEGFTLINADGENVRFVESDDGDSTVRMEPNEDDVAAILGRIDEASRQSDWVVASLHGHEGEAGGLNDRVVPDFHEEFARACIDTGADLFMGHGSHLLRGIEIYDGTPIFYSLGNFVMQNETVTRLPTELYERYDVDPTATPADLFDARVFDEEETRIGFLSDQGFWETVVPVCEYEDGVLDRIELYPLELGFEAPRSQRGRPLLATGETATRILTDVADLSSPYGTAVSIEDGTGIVEI